jgi:hypothetical protein
MNRRVGWAAGQILVLLALMTGCMSSGPRLDLSIPLAGDAESRRGYVGIALRDTQGEDGPVVSWIRPGPLQGEGKRSPFADRGDILLSANGQQVTSESFKELIDSLEAGDPVKLIVRRTGGNVEASVAQVGPGTSVETIDIALGHRSEWTGPVYADTPARPAAVEPATDQPAADSVTAFLNAELDAHEIRAPVDQLRALFAETVTQRGGYNMLSRVRNAFLQPTSLPQVADGITRDAQDLHRTPAAILTAGAGWLDVDAPALTDDAPAFTVPEVAAAELLRRLVAADIVVERALAAIDTPTQERLPDVVGRYQANWDTGDEPRLWIRCLRASMVTDFAALFQAAADLMAYSAPRDGPEPHHYTIKPPRSLRSAIRGGVLAVVQDGDTVIVYGGPGNNEYDMTRISAVIDPSGNDTYLYRGNGLQVPRTQLIVDVEGDDTYVSRGGPGPGSATLGVNLVFDYAGDDEYRAGLRGCGAALLGIGLIVDHKGEDEYHGSKWTHGAGFYGLGGIVDLGGNWDVYWTHCASQGIGGPRGAGVIYDAGGNDLYRAHGPTPSAYGVAATYYGLSQGVAFGIRGFDSAGIGLLLDRGGNDRYEAGEFSQGGGYYWGIGILDDRHGDDLYYGDRYSQGFGCHQAMGVLRDRAGNDTYFASMAANQGGAWDIGMGLLIDDQGNDAYRAKGLSQGGASMQGIGWLLDLAGRDRYVASQPAQGMSRGNRYHYERTGCMSWSVFLDAGGSDDIYKDDRENGKRQSIGSFNEKRPEDSALYGLFIDTAEKMEFSDLK